MDKSLILKGPPDNYSIPKDWFMGEYFINCLKKRKPDDVFCIDGISGKCFTCQEILDQVLKTLIILRDFGVKSGDVVTIISENSVKYCIVLLATYYAGAAANLLNPFYTTGELTRVLNITKPKVIFCSKSPFQKLCITKNEGVFINQIVLLEDVSDEDRNMFHVLLLDTLLKNAVISNDKIKPPKVSKDETLLILLSSGTTGLPKCVMISHESCRCSSAMFGDADYIGCMPGDSLIAVLPFFHIFGGGAISVAVLYSIKLVILPSFQPDVYLQCIEKYSITQLFAVPSIVSFLTNHPLTKRYQLSSLKCIVCTGSSLSVEAQQKFRQIYHNTSIVQLYGATEFSGGIIARSSQVLSKPDSVGKLLPDMEAMVWDTNLCKVLGPLETGELCFRGPSFMKGYIDVENNDVDKYGFYHTGDLGYYDGDHYFYIVGRIKEIIKYKGFQVAPAELENILLLHDAVAECAVIGTPDERAGQLATGCIVRKQGSNVTEKEIIEYVAEKISVQKHLHGGVKFMSSIPRNASGKILRDKLLELCDKK